jgi:oligopeptide transport system ATP-binding protein
MEVAIRLAGTGGIMSDDLLHVEDLRKHFPIKGGFWGKVVGKVHAVDGVNLKVGRSETLGIVGESGCGKSTLGRSILRLYEIDGGRVLFEGSDLAKQSKSELRNTRRNMQMIFQDPYESLDSRQTIESILTEPFLIHRIFDKNRIKEEILALLNRVGLSASVLDRYPHEFSGGQRQRIGIARAIALKPKLIICDEPVSALDVSIQSQVLNLLQRLQRDMELSYVFIAHNLAVVRHVSDRVAVMYLGQIVELTDSQSIYKRPLHPYTRALISAIPNPDPLVKVSRVILKGDVPSPINPPSGCRFHPRCPHAIPRCSAEKPELRDLGAHHVACHLAEKIG